MTIDRWDILAGLGVALIAVGVWFVQPVGVLFWLGASSLVMSILGASRSGHTE